MNTPTPKTTDQIEEINRQRRRCLALLCEAKRIMKQTECSLGADIIGEALGQITEGGMDEY